MRKTTAILAWAACLIGCGNPPSWWGKGPGPAEPPVSMPTSADPASRPADTPPVTGAAPAPEPASSTGAGEPLAAPVPEPASPSAADASPRPEPAPAPTVALSPRPAPAPRPRPPAAAGGADKSVMAYVNDVPVPMEEFVRLLIAGHGMPMAQQLIANEVVRQEAERRNVSVSDQEVASEHARTLQEMFGDVQDANQRERLLKQLLERNKVSPQQWDLTMRRNAMLAKLADKSVVVADDDLQREFTRQYERKVEVQHIQTATLADAQKALRELASGAEFGAMVRKYSVGPSAEEDGLLAPFGAKDAGTPPALREAALAMTRLGEVSEPIQVGTAFHLIKLIRILDPKDVKFEDVKETLRAAVRERKMRAMAQDILQILVRGAKVQYVQPILKAQADEGK